MHDALRPTRLQTCWTVSGAVRCCLALAWRGRPPDARLSDRFALGIRVAMAASRGAAECVEVPLTVRERSWAWAVHDEAFPHLASGVR